MTEVSVMRDRYARGWPRHDTGDRVYPLPLGRALKLGYSTDAHFAAYRTPNGRRLVREAIDEGTPIELTCIVFDIDCPETHGTSTPAPEHWRSGLRDKVRALSQHHPKPFFYETKGGARVVYRQLEATVLRSHEDAKTWTQDYAIAVAYLARTVGIEADPACADWQRLYRLPRATREAHGSPEKWATIGDPDNVGALVIRATDADIAAAKRGTIAFRKPRQASPSNIGAGGDGLFYHALRLRGHVGSNAARGGWIAVCPNRAQHTVDTDWSDTTIVVPPDSGREIGLILCKHGHCWERFTVKQWMRMFSDAELEAARSAAGIVRRSAA